MRRREGGCGRGRTGVGGEGEEGLARVGAPRRGREGCLEEEVGGERGRGGRCGRDLSGCASRGRGQPGLGVQGGLSFPPPRLRRRPRSPERCRCIAGTAPVTRDPGSSRMPGGAAGQEPARPSIPADSPAFFPARAFWGRPCTRARLSGDRGAAASVRRLPPGLLRGGGREKRCRGRARTGSTGGGGRGLGPRVRDPGAARDLAQEARGRPRWDLHCAARRALGASWRPGREGGAMGRGSSAPAACAAPRGAFRSLRAPARRLLGCQGREALMGGA